MLSLGDEYLDENEDIASLNTHVGTAAFMVALLLGSVLSSCAVMNLWLQPSRGVGNEGGGLAAPSIEATIGPTVELWAVSVAQSWAYWIGERPFNVDVKGLKPN